MSGSGGLISARFDLVCPVWPICAACELTDSSLRDTVPGLTGLQLDANVPSSVLKIRVWLIVVA